MTLVSSLSRAALTIAAVLVLSGNAFAQGAHMTGTFSGAKVNAGSVTHSMQAGKHVLTLSADFKVPDTPDPHWQVVDSKGTVYLLQRLASRTTRSTPRSRCRPTSRTSPRCRFTARGPRPCSARRPFSSTLTLNE